MTVLRRATVVAALLLAVLAAGALWVVATESGTRWLAARVGPGLLPEAAGPARELAATGDATTAADPRVDGSTGIPVGVPGEVAATTPDGTPAVSDGVGDGGTATNDQKTPVFVSWASRHRWLILIFFIEVRQIQEFIRQNAASMFFVPILSLIPANLPVHLIDSQINGRT